MLIFADQPLPEQENDAPDWTYEELIDTFVVDYSGRWLERKRRFSIDGVVSEYDLKLIVERRSFSNEPSNSTLGTFDALGLPDYRFWRLDKDGLKEIDKAKYHYLANHPNVKNSGSFSEWFFCLEDTKQHIVVFSRYPHGVVRCSRDQIARGSDGKLFRVSSEMLGMN